MQKEKIILGVLILFLIAVNYNFVNGFLERNFLENYESVQVERVIDGDTVVVNGSSMRLLGINSPEKGEEYYKEAGEFLKEKVMNKTIKAEKHGKDKYYRELVYLFDLKNINLEIVEKGYANYYFPSGKDKYYDDFVKAWKTCLENNENLCEKSSDKCSECIEIRNFGYNKDVILYNKCGFDCDLTNWNVKDEGRKKLIFGNLILKPYESTKITPEDFGNYDYIWTKTGDSIFIRDSENKLVLWESY